ncbi:hypothetical protein FH972_025516 [Carpinus fangiana]|uniref:Major facilitator superfamily (MFS) profile domain-containing protein n=1 Tax=Carpinus fangiana TaxID=176857 RepID=A0A5N6L3V4_9ROSI|nr:hypothetical protein FH972_025516 [Carpinus fangiana]
MSPSAGIKRWAPTLRRKLVHEAEREANPVETAQRDQAVAAVTDEKADVSESASPTTISDTTGPATAPDGTPEDQIDEEKEYPHGAKLALICLGLVMAVFCFALPPLLPVAEALTPAASLFAVCACQLTYGKLYTILPVKWVFFTATVIFEIGNVVAGTANSSATVIGGRVITGVGCAGMNAGVFIIIANIVPVHKRPIYISSIGSIYSVAAVVGPIIGGSLAEGATWRWCFYINLPLGAIAMGCIVFFLDGRFLMHKEQKTLRDFWAEFDLFGSVIFVGCIICLLLALQWGGVTYAWNSGRIIALLVAFAVSLVGFLLWMWYKQEKALLPLRIARQRSVASGWWWSFCAGAANVSLLFYVSLSFSLHSCLCTFVFHHNSEWCQDESAPCQSKSAARQKANPTLQMPIWFQAVKGASPTKSGLMVLPFLIGWIVCAVLAGIVVSRIGYVAPLMLLGTVLMSIGAGLLSTLHPASGAGAWIGFQIIYSAGAGMGQNQPTTAIQAVLAHVDIATGTALVVFAQTLGAAIFVGVAQNVFIARLSANLAAAVPGFDAALLRDSGATDLDGRFTVEQLPAAIGAYNGALTTAFKVAIGASVATIIGGLCIQWKSLKKKETKTVGDGGEDGAKESDTEKKEEKSPRTSASEESLPPVDRAA